MFEVLETPAGDGVTRRHGDTEREFVASSRPSVAVSLDDVHYAYDQGSRTALNGVTFDIRPGEKVALVGPSGAGKSTIAALLLGFIQPTSGTITLANERDPVPASSFELPAIAWVSQLPYLFNTTVAENIRLGRSGAGQDNVVQAAQQAGADDFIRALPQGYETGIGERARGSAGDRRSALPWRGHSSSTCRW